MACKAVAALLTSAALLIGFLSPVTPAKTAHGFRATRVHLHPGNYSAAARRDARRLALFSYRAAAEGAATTTSTVSASSRHGLLEALAENGAGAYHMSLSVVGTPTLAFPAIIDAGSDLTWTQCAPCTACFAQPTPLYDPALSSTFSKLPCASPLCQALPSAFRACNATGCVYDYRYIVGFTAGYLAADTLAIGDATSLAGVAFGCSTANGGDMDGASGIVGLGRGALSLLSQLGVGRFPYCLRSGADPGASPILFGSTDLPVTGSTFGFTAAGEGGVIVDSGATFTYLAEAGVRDAEAGVPVADGRTDEGERRTVRLRPLLRGWRRRRARAEAGVSLRGRRGVRRAAAELLRRRRRARESGVLAGAADEGRVRDRQRDADGSARALRSRRRDLLQFFAPADCASL